MLTWSKRGGDVKGVACGEVRVLYDGGDSEAVLSVLLQVDNQDAACVSSLHLEFEETME